MMGSLDWNAEHNVLTKSSTVSSDLSTNIPAIRVAGMRSGGADVGTSRGVVCSSGIPREGVGCAVAHTRDVDHLEDVLEGFLLEKSCNGDVGEHSVVLRS